MKKLEHGVGYGAKALLLCLFLICLFMASALADTVVPVSSHQDIINAIAAHTGESFTMEIQSNIQLGGTPAIVIPKSTNVTLTNKAGADVTITRDTSSNGANSRIDIQGGLTIRENAAGGSLFFSGAAASNYCAGNPQLAVSGDGSYLTIESGTFTGHHSGYGVIYSADGATTTINGGTFAGNTTPHNPFNHGTGQGGVIWAANCDLIINGGTFDGNTSALIGGVIYYDGRTRDHKLSVTGGTFKNNTANGAFGGGAIFIDWDNSGGKYSIAEITGGVFDGNQAPTGAGGALYIQLNAEVKISNSSIWNNHATGHGGGIWNCATGGGGYYNFHGMYLAGNTAADLGDDFYSVPKQVVTEVYLTDYAYTGAKYNWTYDDGIHAAGTLAPSDYYQESNAEIALASGLPNGEEPSAKVFFRNNVGLTGGAIANNGVLRMGEESLLSVQKQTTVSTAETFTVQIKLVGRNNQPMSGSFLYRDSAMTANSRITFDANGLSALTLASGQQITLLDLPVGTHYTVTEIDLPNGWELASPNDLTGDILAASRSVPVQSLSFQNRPIVNTPTPQPSSTPAPTPQPTVQPTPSPTPKPVPKTGDDQPVGALLALIALSAAGALALLLTRKRAHKTRA